MRPSPATHRGLKPYFSWSFTRSWRRSGPTRYSAPVSVGESTLAGASKFGMVVRAVAHGWNRLRLKQRQRCAFPAYSGSS